MLSCAVENITDCVYIAGLDGKITYVNDDACAVYGYDRSELLGANVSILGEILRRRVPP